MFRWWFCSVEIEDARACLRPARIVCGFTVIDLHLYVPGIINFVSYTWQTSRYGITIPKSALRRDDDPLVGETSLICIQSRLMTNTAELIVISILLKEFCNHRENVRVTFESDNGKFVYCTYTHFFVARMQIIIEILLIILLLRSGYWLILYILKKFSLRVEILLEEILQIKNKCGLSFLAASNHRRVIPQRGNREEKNEENWQNKEFPRIPWARFVL